MTIEKTPLPSRWLPFAIRRKIPYGSPAIKENRRTDTYVQYDGLLAVIYFNRVEAATPPSALGPARARRQAEIIIERAVS